MPYLIIPKSEKELEAARSGDLVDISLEGGKDFRFMIYEGQIGGQDAFMEIDSRSKQGEIPTINSWRSHRRYIQFENGAILSHLHRNLENYTPLAHPDIYENKLRQFCAA